MFSTAEEIEKFDIDQRRRSRVNYMTKLYLEHENENNDQTAGKHLGAITVQYNEQMHALYGDDIFSRYNRG
jgi:hypothetical protein